MIWKVLAVVVLIYPIFAESELYLSNSDDESYLEPDELLLSNLDEVLLADVDETNFLFDEEDFSDEEEESLSVEEFEEESLSVEEEEEFLAEDAGLFENDEEIYLSKHKFGKGVDHKVYMGKFPRYMGAGLFKSQYLKRRSKELKFTPSIKMKVNGKTHTLRWRNCKLLDKKNNANEAAHTFTCKKHKASATFMVTKEGVTGNFRHCNKKKTKCSWFKLSRNVKCFDRKLSKRKKSRCSNFSEVKYQKVIIPKMVDNEADEQPPSEEVIAFRRRLMERRRNLNGMIVINIYLLLDLDFIRGDGETGRTYPNAQAALAYATALVEKVSDIYEQYGFELKVVGSRIHSSRISATKTTSAYLNACQAIVKKNAPSGNIDLVHVLSTRRLGGGLAYINGLYSRYGYGVSANIAGSFNQWDIYVTAHELGHNFGLQHTHHSSVGVDNCGTSGAGKKCQKGTIMSYCHTCSGGMGNIQLIFHAKQVQTLKARWGAGKNNLANTKKNGGGGGGGSCVDVAKYAGSCPGWKARYCGNHKWVRETCPKTCGLCGSKVVNGGWSAFGACSVTCGTTGTQVRQCNNPSPSGGGRTCSGANRQNCNRKTCPTTSCKDKATYVTKCPGWKARYCGNHSWVRANCQKTCGLCSNSSCADDTRYASRCPGWKAKYCSNHSGVKKVCPKTCGLC